MQVLFDLLKKIIFKKLLKNNIQLITLSYNFLSVILYFMSGIFVAVYIRIFLYLVGFYTVIDLT